MGSTLSWPVRAWPPGTGASAGQLVRYLPGCGPAEGCVTTADLQRAEGATFLSWMLSAGPPSVPGQLPPSPAEVILGSSVLPLLPFWSLILPPPCFEVLVFFPIRLLWLREPSSFNAVVGRGLCVRDLLSFHAPPTERAGGEGQPSPALPQAERWAPEAMFYLACCSAVCLKRLRLYRGHSCQGLADHHLHQLCSNSSS